MATLYSKRVILLVLLLLIAVVRIYATHVRAGEITAERIDNNPLRYRFTFVFYRDKGGVEPGDVILDFGDNTSSAPTKAIKREDIGNNTEKVTYVFTHTYAGGGTFIVSTVVPNRNAGVLNLSRGATENLPFYVETIMKIDPLLGINNTPVLLYPPIDKACSGERFVHNPVARDKDGDSLAYRMTVPKVKRNTPVDYYRDPNKLGGNSEAGGDPTFTLNPETGELVWDTPPFFGTTNDHGEPHDEYNIAFVIEEWRKLANGKFIKIGEVVRDMQILVEDCKNNPPVLQIPNDTCIVAGSGLNEQIRATDPDNNRIRLRAFGGVFLADFPQPQATFTPNGVAQPNPATGTFQWQTECLHVRAQPYQVVFQAEDLPPDTARKLVDLKTWQITVVGPQPTGLQAEPSGTSMILSWDNYSCPNASEMIVYRKEGCTPLTPDPCQTDLTSLGYVEVGRVPIGTTTFTDNNKEQGLERGKSYSYRIQASFAPPARGTSLPSEEQCVSLLLDVPFITNVTVVETDSINGRIVVQWTQPMETKTGGPYYYELYRTEGLDGNTFTGPIVTKVFEDLDPTNETVFEDRRLDTKNKAYRYQLKFYVGQVPNKTLVDSTAKASSVWLEAAPQPYAIELNWKANVPWDNTNTTHKIYRYITDPQAPPQPNPNFTLLAEVPVTDPASFRFTDNGNGEGLDSDLIYCYRVETVGKYGDVRIKSPLLNFSQRQCASPIDTIRPCPPVLAIDVLDCSTLTKESFCNVTTFSNKLTWTYPNSINGNKCDEDIVAYKLYYKRYEDDKEFTLLATINSPLPPDTFYIHQNLPHYAGCYYVTAVDEDGSESNPSNTVCKDNCPYYELPNVITPNGDGKNDELVPFPCPRFVESVKFTVYNRWGRPVFETDKIDIAWNGTLKADETGGGEGLSAGVYYYLAEVKFHRLRRKDEKVNIKGWVHILR